MLFHEFWLYSSIVVDMHIYLQSSFFYNKINSTLCLPFGPCISEGHPYSFLQWRITSCMHIPECSQRVPYWWSFELFCVFGITDSAAVNNLEPMSCHNFGRYIWGRLLELWFLGQREKAHVLLLDITKLFPQRLFNFKFSSTMLESDCPQIFTNRLYYQMFGLLLVWKIMKNNE